MINVDYVPSTPTPRYQSSILTSSVITDYFSPTMKTVKKTGLVEEQLPRMEDVDKGFTRLLARSAGYKEADFYVTPAGDNNEHQLSPVEQEDVQVSPEEHGDTRGVVEHMNKDDWLGTQEDQVDFEDWITSICQDDPSHPLNCTTPL